MECDAIPVDYVDDAEIQAIDLAMAAAGALQAPGTRVLGAPKEADLDQETRDPRRGLIKGILQGQGPSITLSPFRPTIKGTGADEGQWLGGVGGCSAETPEGPGSPSKLRRLAMEDGILPQPPAIGAQLSPSASSPTSASTKNPGDATRDLEEGGDAVEAGQGGVLLQEARGKGKGKGRNLEEENETLRREVESLKERIEALEEDVDDAREAARSSEEDRTRERKSLEDKVAQREAEAKAFRDAWRDGEVAEARLSEAQKRAEAAEMRADALRERLSIVSKAVVSAAATDVTRMSSIEESIEEVLREGGVPFAADDSLENKVELLTREWSRSAKQLHILRNVPSSSASPTAASLSASRPSPRGFATPRTPRGRTSSPQSPLIEAFEALLRCGELLLFPGGGSTDFASMFAPAHLLRSPSSSAAVSPRLRLSPRPSTWAAGTSSMGGFWGLEAVGSRFFTGGGDPQGTPMTVQGCSAIGTAAGDFKAEKDGDTGAFSLSVLALPTDNTRCVPSCQDDDAFVAAFMEGLDRDGAMHAPRGGRSSPTGVGIGLCEAEQTPNRAGRPCCAPSSGGASDTSALSSASEAIFGRESSGGTRTTVGAPPPVPILSLNLEESLRSGPI